MAPPRASAAPTISSFSPWPYVSPVSKKVTPSSSAAATRRSGSSCSPHQSEPSAQVPKPMAEISKSLSPKRRVRTWSV